MQQELNQHWNKYYDQGRDFNLISFLTINKLLVSYPSDAPKTALDIGCGTGQLTRELWHRGFKATGVDVSESAITIARSLTTVTSTELCYKQIDIEEDSMTDMPFQPYGLTICKLVYAFMHDKPTFLKKVVQLLDDKGIFVVITPLLATTPPEKAGIAVGVEDIDLLREYFNQVTWYEERELGYFVGTKK